MCIRDSFLPSISEARQPPQTPLPLGAHLAEQYTDDLDGLIKRRYIRILTTVNKTNFFVHQGKFFGFEYSLLKEYEKFLEEMGYDPDRVNQYTARAAEGDTIAGDFEDVMSKAGKGPDIPSNLAERALMDIRESAAYYGVTVR